jgi:hypothetical protein
MEFFILKVIKRHIEGRSLLNASQFGFRARHSTTLQCMRPADHVILNFNNKMSTAAVFLDIEKDLRPLVSVEATGVCIPVGNREILLTSVYKSPRRIWSHADNTELLNFRNKCILAGDLDAKHPFWNSAVEFSNAETEEARTMAIEKLVSFITKQNGPLKS